MSGIFQHISDKSQTYLSCISDISQAYLTLYMISKTCLRYIPGISHISGLSEAYIQLCLILYFKLISGISEAYFRHILGVSHAHFTYISGISQG